MSDDQWIERAQNAEAIIGTLRAGNDRLKQKNQELMKTFGARAKTDGSFEINYQVFVDMLGMESALEVRSIIDETYSIKGAAGEKPKVTMPALPPVELDNLPQAITALSTAPEPRERDPLTTIMERLDYLEARLPK